MAFFKKFASFKSQTGFKSMTMTLTIKNNSSKSVGATHGRGLCIYILQCNSTLCYSFKSNMLMDVPKMQYQDHNLIGSSGAIFDGWLYLAGGFKGSSAYVEPTAYLNCAEKLNLKTWEWQTLPQMQIPRAFGTGLAHKNKFYIVAGDATLEQSSEIHDPSSNSLQLLKSFAPKEADGFAVASLNSRLLMLTWSNRLGVKLWMWLNMVNPYIGERRLISFFPDKQIERLRLRQYWARMVQVGKEVRIVVRENDSVCQVDGASVWPVFPAPPMFKPDGHKIVLKGYIYAFYFKDVVRISWRQIPAYSI